MLHVANIKIFFALIRIDNWTKNLLMLVGSGLGVRAHRQRIRRVGKTGGNGHGEPVHGIVG